MKENLLDVTVLLPCYNEAEALPVVIKDVSSVMGNTNFSYEILVIDDNSTDASAAIAEKLDCRVIRRIARGGAGAARKTGIIVALGKVIVMLDCDGSYSASYIPEMLKYLPEYDQINGARITEKGSISWLRSPAKWLIRMLASFLAGYRIPDLNTGLKAFKRDSMLRYLWTIPDGFSCVSSMTLAFLCNGHPVKYIPVNYRERIGKSKFHPVKDTYAYLLTVLRLITYFNPLRVFFPAALFCLVFGVLKSLHDYFFVIHRLQLSDIILIITGVIIAFQGLLADLIVAQGRARNYELTKKNE